VRQGTIYGLIDMTGGVTEPSLSGRVRISRATLVVPAINTAAERVNAEIVLVRNELRFEKFSGRSAKGQIIGNGFVNLGRNWQVDTLHFGIGFSGMTINPQPEIFAVAGGSLSMDMAMGRPFSLAGTVDVSEALLAIGFGQSAGSPTASGGTDTAFVYDLRVRGDRNIWLRNSLVDIEASVDLSLRKTLTEEVYAGQLTTVQGNVYYLDHTLRVTTGEIRFPNINKLNPELNIVAELPVVRTEAGGGGSQETNEKIILSVTGTLEQPQLRFSSDPPGWDAAEIVSYLNFNVTPGEIRSLDQKTAVSKLLSQRLLGYFQTQVAKRARGFVSLDYLQVETGLAGGSGNRVTVGKYVGRKFYVSYTQNLASIYPAARIEYYLDKRNEIVAAREEQGSVSLRYRLKLRY